jgi:large subunit ribosomal protein L16
VLSPAKVKFRKQQRGKMRGLSKGGTHVDFGDFGLQALGCGWVTARQLEAGRVAIMRHVRRAGKLWIRVFPDKPIGKKPAETRMGKGKAVPEEWVVVVRPGRVMYELGGVPADVAKEAFRLAAHKLPIRSRFVAREVL